MLVILRFVVYSGYRVLRTKRSIVLTIRIFSDEDDDVSVQISRRMKSQREAELMHSGAVEKLY